jgi:hypothetical protein
MFTQPPLSALWSALRLFLLAAWAGAMIVFAFVFAPAAFAHVGPTPQFAATIAASLRTLGNLGSLFGIAAVALTFVLGKHDPRRAPIVVLFVALAIASVTVENAFIVPKMEATPLLTPAYEALHGWSSRVYSLALLAVLAAFGFSSLPAYRRS